MVEVNIKLTNKNFTKNFDEMIVGIPRAVNVSLRDYSRKLLSQIRKVIRRKRRYRNELSPGRLERDISIRKATNGYRIEMYAPYASAVEEGAMAHTIKPARSSKLRWVRGGHVFYAHKVNHPGVVRPMNARETAILETIDILKNKVKQDITNVIKKLR